MSRKFRKANYEETLDLQVSLRDVLQPEHLARFTVDVITQLDLRAIYAEYGEMGAPRNPKKLHPCLFLLKRHRDNSRG